MSLLVGALLARARREPAQSSRLEGPADVAIPLIEY